MSMQVGLTIIGSEAQSLISSPSDTLKVDSAFSGGSWACAAGAAHRKRADSGSASQGFMAARSPWVSWVGRCCEGIVYGYFGVRRSFAALPCFRESQKASQSGEGSAL